MTIFYCGNMRCDYWQEYSPMREALEGHCTREDTQISADGKCVNSYIMFTDNVKRYRITEGKKTFSVLVDRNIVVRTPDDRGGIIGELLTDIRIRWQSRDVTIEEIH
jgi:hypothetical protein